MSTDKSESLRIFYEAFSGLCRLAPGSEASTLKALEIVRQYRNPLRVLDVGCGVGAQTFVIAQNSYAAIAALDNHQPYLTALEKQAWRLGLATRVKPVLGSMFELEQLFGHDTFDLIWAEGSAYIMGFDQALISWMPMLLDDGIIALTEVSWLTDTPSAAARNFWGQVYPPIRTVQQDIDLAAILGYECLAHFALSKTDWVDGYYSPLLQRVNLLQDKYYNNPQALLVLQSIEEEVDFYERFGHEYGYVFYILRKTFSAKEAL